MNYQAPLTSSFRPAQPAGGCIAPPQSALAEKNTSVRLTTVFGIPHNEGVSAGTLDVVEALSFCFAQPLPGKHLVPARGAETQGLFAFQTQNERGRQCG